MVFDLIVEMAIQTKLGALIKNNYRNGMDNKMSLVKAHFAFKCLNNQKMGNL